jgi:hypothetical protein
MRDPDRTTLEFERNDGGDEPPSPTFGPEHIGHGKTLDHVGIRIRAPYDSHLEFYAKNLGFSSLVRRYEPDPNPLKNMPPWLTASITPAGERVDINWIINSNMGGGGDEAEKNILTHGGTLKSGILFAAFEILETDAAAVCASLKTAGVDAILDTEIAAGVAWGDFPSRALALFPGRPTILVRDLNANLLRFVPSVEARGGSGDI